MLLIVSAQQQCFHLAKHLQLRAKKGSLIHSFHVTESALSDVVSLAGFVSSMRYPDKHPYPKVPRDAFTKEQAEQALCIMDALLEHVQDYYVDDKS